MTLVDMYDGVNVSQWPAGAKYGLVYTDGRFANMQAVKNRFPGIILQTISAVGTGPAMWVDCEPGCVWPPAAAVATYERWRSQGCRGIYCTQAVKPFVRATAAARNSTPESFGADWTGVPHINPDEAQPQYLNTPGDDVSSIPAPAPPAPEPGPAPTPQPVKAETMRVVVATTSTVSPNQPKVAAGEHHLVFGTAYRYIIETPQDIQALITALGPAIPLTGSFIANIPLMP